MKYRYGDSIADRYRVASGGGCDETWQSRAKLRWSKRASASKSANPPTIVIGREEFDRT